MKDDKLKQRILNYLERKSEWVHKGTMLELVRINTSYSPENAGRTLRDLHEEGKLACDKKERNRRYQHNEKCVQERGLSVSYKAVNPRKVKTYTILSGSKAGQKITVS